MPISTRAKFKCDSAEPWSATGPGGSVKLTPVYSTDPNHENKQFWDSTPGGSIELHINNPAGFALFKRDQEYYVDFTPASPGAFQAGVGG
jgi:hypothetical protein